MGYENPGKGQSPEKGSSSNHGSDKKPVDPKLAQGLGKTALGGGKK